MRGRTLLAAAGLVMAGCQPSTGHRQATSGSMNGADPWVLSTTDPNGVTPALLWNGQIGVRLSRFGSPLLLSGTELPAFSLDSYEPDGEERIIPINHWYSSREAPPPYDPATSTLYRQELDMRTGILRTTWMNQDRKRQILVEREAVVDPYGAPVYGEQWSMKAKDSSQSSARDKYLEDDFNQTYYVPKDFDGGAPPPDDFDTLVDRAKLYWEDFWKTDIEIDGPVEDQQAIRSFLFYLRTAMQPQNEHAISPLGLSSRQYFGHVFWDADVWVFPALSLLDPEAAATIPLYRLDKMSGARQNYLAWVKAGRPIGNGQSLGHGPAKPNAVMFPWESSVSGRETVPGDSRFQHHISGTVSFAIQHAAALGLVEHADAAKVRKAVGEFYADRASGADFKSTMSPDEFHTGDNDLYTNIVANLALGKEALKLPRDNKSLLSYDGDPVKSYKQAAAVLAIYPLQFPEAEKEAATLMKRFGDKVIENGPAMSDSVHATIWARLGEKERAYATWQKSWRDFTHHPLLLFSEKRSKDVTYFTTGAGGCLQSVLYGFAGLRMDPFEPKGVAWKVPLKAGWWLSCTPHLPAEWKSMKLKGLRVLGRSYNLELKGKSVTPI